MLAGLVGGCSGGSEGNGGDASATPMALQGLVHGGQAPIVGSTVVLRAASEQGLSNAVTVASATTDSNGNFNFSFSCPSPTAQMYLTSTAGNPGGGANTAIRLMAILGPCANLPDSAIINELTTVAAAYTANAFIGPSGCSDCSGGLPQSVTNISGPAPGLPNAMGNAALLVSPLNGQVAPTLPTSAECPATGTVPANCLTVRKLNTAANALAACVNSSGPTSAQCVQLFDCATVGAAFTSATACTPPADTTLPGDTLQAMLNIVRNPAKVSIPGIDDTSSRDVVFSPAFSTHFTDYTMSLSLTGGGLNGPVNLAVDGNGDIWVANSGGNSVIELSPNGEPLSGGSGFAVGSIPYAVAIDANGNAWVSNHDDGNLTILSPAGQPILGSPITADGLDGPYGIAISPDGDAWVASSDSKVIRFSDMGVMLGSNVSSPSAHITKGIAIDGLGNVFATNVGDNVIAAFSSNGTPIGPFSNGSLNAPEGVAIDINNNLWVANSGANSLIKFTEGNTISSAAFTGGGLHSPTGIAIDASGNVWVANANSTAISEFSGAGTALSPSAGFVGAGLSDSFNEYTPAVDPSGNVWFANQSNNSLTVFFGAAAPTRTPLVAAISQGFVP
jgi:streptogramin lyase